ncbi:GNAT family N-acetyltransferase [Microterricola gilva]|uniref:GNAT family N-acetyltransferase n=1 Tax=Microterricola gilva TaxID=393267 RepID=UPI001F5E5839|nr:GNAT family N-acetyltransferase [Microterricola gilva]
MKEPDSPWIVRVARTGDEPIGFAMAGPRLESDVQKLPGERQLYSLYLLANWHGSGAGQALLDAVLNGQPAVLWVAQENPRAIAFYRRNGFEFTGDEQTDPEMSGLTTAQMRR